MFNISVDSTKSDAISELDRRLKNPFWSGFALAWITWNWRVWYLTFFVSESLVGNKIAEIQRMYEYNIFDFLPFFHALPGFLLNWIVMPVFISGIITFWLPKLTDKFLERQKKNKENEETILRENIKEETETTKTNTKLLKAQKEELEALRQKLKAENDAEIEKRANELAQEKLTKFTKESQKSEQELWDNDYINLTKIHKTSMSELSTLIYDKEGYNYRYDNSNYVRIFEVHNLITRIKGKNDSLVFQLTEKGKYFLKKHSLDE